MEIILKLYSELIKIYTEQIDHLERIKESYIKIQWDSVSVLNSRMFLYDDYLLNMYHGGFCFEEKNAVMPYLENFIAHYELLTPEQKKEFDARKNNDGYSSNLDSLINSTTPIIDYLKSQLVELEKNRQDCKIPFPPKRKNATRQWTKYLEDEKEYKKQMKSLQNCKDEVQARIEKIERIQSELNK